MSVPRRRDKNRALGKISKRVLVRDLSPGSCNKSTQRVNRIFVTRSRRIRQLKPPMKAKKKMIPTESARLSAFSLILSLQLYTLHFLAISNHYMLVYILVHIPEMNDKTCNTGQIDDLLELS